MLLKFFLILQISMKNTDRFFFIPSLLNLEYSFVYLFMCVSFLLCSFLLFLTCLLSIKNILFDKKLAYECGFEPFTSGHLLLDISFAFVAILFLLFDLELVFLYP